MDIRYVAVTPYYLVVDKPSGLPTVPLKKDPPEKDTLLGRVARKYPEVLKFGKNGWEGGVLHRLDTPTRGLVLIARDQNSYAVLRKEQEEGAFLKSYLAKSSLHRDNPGVGYPEYGSGDVTSGEEVVIASWFRPYGQKGTVVRPVSKNSPKPWKSKTTGSWYETRVKQIGVEGDTHLFACALSTGFRHQIRCHLAWAGWPLDGDESYHGLKGGNLALEAVGLSFYDPVSKKAVSYSLG